MRSTLIICTGAFWVVAMLLPVSHAACPANPLGCIDILDTSLGKELVWGPVAMQSHQVENFWKLPGSLGTPGGGSGFDAAGNFYTILRPKIFRYRLDGTQEVIAQITDPDSLSPWGIDVDQANGRIYLAFWEGHTTSASLVAITGLPRLLDLYQSYEPTSDALGFVVPKHPEGFQYADWFDTYYGTLATVGDWNQLQPLQCGYPASPPSIGDYLTVPDPLPTPAVGQGYYYVTAVNYQGQTRWGRQANGGVLSGRDPAGLPGCEE